MADAAATAVSEGGEPIASATETVQESFESSALSEEDSSRTDRPVEEDRDNLATFDLIKAKVMEESTEISKIHQTAAPEVVQETEHCFKSDKDVEMREFSENKNENSVKFNAEVNDLPKLTELSEKLQDKETSKTDVQFDTSSEDIETPPNKLNIESKIIDPSSQKVHTEPADSTESANAPIEVTGLESTNAPVEHVEKSLHSTEVNKIAEQISEIESSDTVSNSANVNAELPHVMIESAKAMTEVSDALTESSDALTESTDGAPVSTFAVIESSNAVIESTNTLTESTESTLVTANQVDESMEENGEFPTENSTAVVTGIKIKIENVITESEHTADETDVFIKSEFPEDVEMSEQTERDRISADNQLNGIAEVHSTMENGDDEERTVTMLDVLQEQEELEDNADAVLGASDDNNCTYSEGYIKRQALYACLTCCSEARVDPTKRAGVCLACSLSCHENHELIELYTKRNFCCDCGNPNFNSNPCVFTKDKKEFNLENKYDQNFSALYCICHRPYPDPESTVEDEMIQCIVCEDWLHASHLDAVVPENDQYSEMICKSCMNKNEFLHDYLCYAVDMEENNHIDVGNGNDKSNNDFATASKSSDSQQKHLDNEQNINIEMEISTESAMEASSKESQAESVEEGNKQDMSIEKVNENVINDSSKNQSDDICNKLITEETTTVTNDDDKIIVQEEHTTDVSYPAETIKLVEYEKEKTESAIAKNKTEENEANIPAAENVEKVIENSSVDVRTHYEGDTENKIIDNPDVEKPESNEAENKTKNETKINNENRASEENSNEKSVFLGDVRNEAAMNKSSSEEACTSEETITEGKTISEKNNGEEIISEETITENKTILEENSCKETFSKDSKISEENSDENEKKSEKNNCEETISEGSELCTVEQTKIDETDADIVEKVLDKIVSAENTEVVSTVDMKMIDGIQKDAPVKNVSEEEILLPEQISKEGDKLDSDIEMKEVDKNQDDAASSITPMETKKQTESNEEQVQVTAEINTNKRKLSTEITGNSEEEISPKKTKLDDGTTEETDCKRPKPSAKRYKGATFWPCSWRQKLCSCSNCVAMYRDRDVLFLLDLEDTVTAYEDLGKAKNEGKSSQYEKGLKALSSLDRIQQINALTEYNRMKDELLNFLISFKNRQEVVKVEDIEKFFSDIKPKKKSDGVYFCR